jgi:HK97 family phage major capsid protein
MPYNNVTDRTDVGPLIPDQRAREILDDTAYQSAALQLFTRVPMSSKVYKQPVLSALPMAYWVSGDTGLKQTTEMAWGEKTMTAEELAVIVPVPNNVIADATFDLFGAFRPKIAEAVARALDAAIFLGINKPASWPTDIVTSATSAGNDVARGTNNAASGGLQGDIDDLMGLVEQDGFAPNGVVSDLITKGRLRKLRDTTGQKLLDVSQNTYEGLPIRYTLDGLWPAGLSKPELILGDFRRGVVGVRADLNYEVFKEGVIQDNTGAIVYNLLQQDMSALRVTARFAFQVSNPINYRQPTEAQRYPFGVLLSPAA